MNALKLSLTFAIVASATVFTNAHTVILVENAWNITYSNGPVQGVAGAESGFSYATIDGSRVYLRIGSKSYWFSEYNTSKKPRRGYRVEVTAPDPATDGVYAFYPDRATVVFGPELSAGVPGGGSGGI